MPRAIWSAACACHSCSAALVPSHPPLPSALPACCSEAQRQETAAFLLPLLEAECYEGVQVRAGRRCLPAGRLALLCAWHCSRRCRPKPLPCANLCLAQACIEEALLAKQQAAAAATGTGTGIGTPGSLAAKTSAQQAGEAPQCVQRSGQAAESQLRSAEREQEGEARLPGRVRVRREAEAEAQAEAEGGQRGSPRRQLLPLLEQQAEGGAAAGHGGATPHAGSGGDSASGSREDAPGMEGDGSHLNDPHAVIDLAVAAMAAGPTTATGGQTHGASAGTAGGTTHFPAATTAAAVVAAAGTTHFPVHFSPC